MKSAPHLQVCRLVGFCLAITLDKSKLAFPARCVAGSRLYLWRAIGSHSRAYYRAQVRVQGFVSRANPREGEYRLVLHAAHIDVLNTESSED